MHCSPGWAESNIFNSTLNVNKQAIKLIFYHLCVSHKLVEEVKGGDWGRSRVENMDILKAYL